MKRLFAARRGQSLSTKLAIFIAAFSAIALNLGVSHVPANAEDCQIGSSSSCPATSPQEINNLYGTSTNGTYWLRVNGVAREAYVVMDTASSWGNGYWILLMKGSRGTTNFGYSSTNFTSNTTVLNENSPVSNFTSDAKYHAYNSTPLSQMMAVLASPANGSISNQGDIANNSFGGHTWLESAGGSTAQSKLTTSTLLNSPANYSFSSVPVSKYRQTSSTSSSQVFSYQTGTGLYGYDSSCGAGYKVRWGILWNNETNNLGSCDAYVGIGGANGSTDHSPRDLVSYKDGLTSTMPNSNGWGLGDFAFQIWGKMAAPNLTAPAAPTVANAALGQVTVSWTAPAGSPTDYVVQYKLTSASSWGTTPSQAIVVAGTSTTITGLSNSTSYDFRVTARTSTNSSAPSAVTSKTITPRTISFNANGGTTSMADVVVADSVATSLPSNTFVRDRYTFRGWNTAANGSGTSYSDGAQASAVGGNLTLYAMWTSLDDRAWTASAQQDIYTTTTPIPTATTAAFTTEAWIYPTTATGTWRNVFGSGTALTNESQRFFVGLHDSNQMYLSVGGAIETFFDTPIKFNRWAHIAIAVSGDASPTVDVFIDGQLFRTFTSQPNRQEIGSAFTIGSNTIVNYNWTGEIDQVKIWTSRLTSDQIAESMHTYQKGTLTASATLRAHYDFNEYNAGALLNRTGDATYNLTMSNTVGENRFSTSRIVQTGNAHASLQTYVKFNRSYLTAAGGWTPPSGFAKAKLLVVGGGGGAGVRHAGGGGAGGFIETEVSLTQAAQKITVGMGGQGGPYMATSTSSATPATTRGQNSIAFSQTAVGGGAGAGRGTDSSFHSGGSGGGTDAPAATNTPGTGQSGQGNSGGQGSNSPFWTGGGGGGAGAAGAAAASGQGGKGGDGRASSITGTSVFYAGGGGGASGNTGIAGGAGGSGGGGAGGTTGSTSGTGGTSGTNGTGGGGGGGGYADAVWGYAGGSGGSGVVILSYGATMDVSQNPGGAKAGSNFQRPIKVQLKNADGSNYSGADQQVTLAAASSSILQQTVSGTTTNIASATVTSSNGVATFSNIGFRSGISGDQTLTITADAFVGTSLTVTPTFAASAVTITSSGATNGSFVDGSFQSNTSGTANILNSDLVTVLATSNAEIETSGSITISAAVESSTAYSLTLKAGTDILQGAVAVSTTGGAITYWADSDVGATRGGIQTARGSSIATNGGALTMSGGSDITTGYAKGTANTNQRGLNLQGAITTGAGNVIIRGEDGPSEIAGNTNWGAGVLFNDDSSLETSSGTITITGLTNTDNTSYNHRHAGVIIGMEYVAGELKDLYADAFIKSDAGSITINGTGSTGVSDTTTLHRDGIIFRKSSVTSTSGNISISGRTTRASAYDINFGASRTGNTISTGGAVTITGDTTGSSSAFSTSTISAGGTMTLYVNKPTFTSMTLNGAGSKIIQHPTTATNFGAAVDITGVTFASTTASLTVGRSGVTPNQTVTLGNANTSIAGNVTVYGAAITQSGAVVTTSGGNVTYSGAGAYSQTGALTSAGTITQSGATTVSVTAATSAVGAISYSGSSTVSNSSAGTITSTGSSVTLASTGSTMTIAGNVIAKTSLSISQTAGYSGAGTLTAQGGTLSITGGTTVAMSGALNATGNITISGSTEITNPTGGTINSDAAISITSSTTSINLSKAVTAGTSLAITPKTTYAGAGVLTAGTTLTISGGSSVAPTGTIAASGNIAISGTAAITNTGATITSSAGTVSITSSASSISLAAAVSGTGIAMAPSTTYDGAGSLTATAGTLTISGGTSVAPTGALLATGNITLSGSSYIYTVTGASIESTGGSVQLTSTGSYIRLAKNVTASTSITISPNGLYDGAGALTAGTTLTISGGTTVAPAGNLTSVGNMAVSGSGRVTLNALTASVTGTGTLTISGGTKTSTDGGLYLTGANVTSKGGALTLNGNAVASWGFYFGSTSKVQTTTGDITINGDAPSGVWGGYLEAVDVLSDSGAIKVDGKSSYGINVGYTATTNLGAISPANSISNISMIGNVYCDANSSAVKYRTSGSVVIESTGTTFLVAPTIKAHTFDNNASVRIGRKPV